MWQVIRIVLTMSDPIDIAEQFEKHLNSPKQTWLLGAGISNSSNIPLMRPLTDRVFDVANTIVFADNNDEKRIIEFIQNDINENANIEDFLTHLADFTSLAERARNGSVSIDGQLIEKEKLVHVHEALLKIIADTVRWGYKPASAGDENETELIGDHGKAVVKIDEHLKFVQAIFDSGRAGLEKIRTPVEFFTTNYDTLLEDALALNQIEYQDGFSGGAVGFWKINNYHNRELTRAIVTKLHGSIDWQHQTDNPSQLLRVRSGDSYPYENGVVMIYPQATKYLDMQKNPFAQLFQRFRHRLEQGADQVLLICGYSFGDEHINAEIENVLATLGNQLTVIAFADEPDNKLPAKLEYWRNQTPWGSQVFIASSQGLYQGISGPFFKPADGARDWWTFSGVTRLFSQGLPNDVLENMQ